MKAWMLFTISLVFLRKLNSQPCRCPRYCPIFSLAFPHWDLRHRRWLQPSAATFYQHCRASCFALRPSSEATGGDSSDGAAALDNLYTASPQGCQSVAAPCLLSSGIERLVVNNCYFELFPFCSRWGKGEEEWTYPSLLFWEQSFIPNSILWKSHTVCRNPSSRNSCLQVQPVGLEMELGGEEIRLKDSPFTEFMDLLFAETLGIPRVPLTYCWAAFLRRSRRKRGAFKHSLFSLGSSFHWDEDRSLVFVTKKLDYSHFPCLKARAGQGKKLQLMQRRVFRCPAGQCVKDHPVTLFLSSAPLQITVLIWVLESQLCWKLNLCLWSF